jgi:hypothetical protein
MFRVCQNHLKYVGLKAPPKSGTYWLYRGCPYLHHRRHLISFVLFCCCSNRKHIKETQANDTYSWCCNKKSVTRKHGATLEFCFQYINFLPIIFHNVKSIVHVVRRDRLHARMSQLALSHLFLRFRSLLGRVRMIVSIPWSFLLNSLPNLTLLEA